LGRQARSNDKHPNHGYPQSRGDMRILGRIEAQQPQKKYEPKKKC
jgi:hypothetical protein